jgi:hypothetical protein
MPRKRTIESDEDRAERLSKNLQDRREAVVKDEEDLDEMVRQSLREHGA